LQCNLSLTTMQVANWRTTTLSRIAPQYWQQCFTLQRCLTCVCCSGRRPCIHVSSRVLSSSLLLVGGLSDGEAGRVLVRIECVKSITVSKCLVHVHRWGWNGICIAVKPCFILYLSVFFFYFICIADCAFLIFFQSMRAPVMHLYGWETNKCAIAFFYFIFLMLWLKKHRKSLPFPVNFWFTDPVCVCSQLSASVCVCVCMCVCVCLGWLQRTIRGDLKRPRILADVKVLSSVFTL